MKRAALVLATSVALFISAPGVYAATKKTVNHGQSKFNVVNDNRPFQTPNGETSFFGQAFVDEHSAGNRFQAGQNPTGKTFPPKAKMPVQLTPVLKTNPIAIAKAAAELLKKGGPGATGLAATAAVQWAVEQLPGASFDPVTGEPVVTNTPPATGTFWATNYYGGTGSGDPVYPTYQAACRALVGAPAQAWHWSLDARELSPTYYECRRKYSDAYCPSCGTQLFGTARQHTIQCANGFDTGTLSCYANPTPSVPFDETHFANLEDALRRVPNSDWYKDLIQQSCAGSSSPGQCYDSLTSWAPLQGPATQSGPVVSTTTTTTTPGGAPTTTTTSMQNHYTYNYNTNNYNYSVRTTTKTTANGSTTTQDTVEDPVEGQEPEEEGPDDEVEPDLDLGDAWKPVYDGYQDIENKIGSTPDLQSLPSHSPWYSFGGGCSPLNLNLPVIGQYRIDYCPFINDYVRPTLGFLFAVFTFSHIFGIWRETTMQVRPM